MRKLRSLVVGDNAAAFARSIDITPPRWANFEAGMPLSREVAIKLVHKIPGLTLDWLYLGRTEGLTVQLSRQLEGIGEEATARRRPARNG